MAVFESRYKALIFFVGDEARRFSNGRYVTEDKEEIKILDQMADVTRVDEPEAPAEEKEEKAEPKRTRKAAAK